MNFETILTATVWSPLGVIISLLFGVLGVYLTVRSRYSGEITFFREQTIELYDAVGSTIEGLTVTYNKENVSENLVLINGSFVNTGKNDISANMVEKPITLELPTGYKWLNANILKKDSRADATISNNNSLQVRTGLFRCGECIKIHALVQVPEKEKATTLKPKTQLHNDLRFTHRITNTKEIKEKEFYPQNEILYLAGIVITVMLSTLFCYQSITIGALPTKETRLITSYKTDNNSTEQVSIKILGSNRFLINSLESNFEKKVLLNELNKNITSNPKITQTRASSTTIITYYLCSSICILLPFILSYNLWNYLKLSKIMSRN
ncbi:hypothetical protein [Maridesulfovibrio sp.]|uniref:hypothetical protein n=1 Tax=Maridesulfovibrio sp. TaxID=2795000 RepID=UPI0029CA90FC|nr:hypothetical protein [Maridesulfovibrio sp.]